MNPYTLHPATLDSPILNFGPYYPSYYNPWFSSPMPPPRQSVPAIPRRQWLVTETSSYDTLHSSSFRWPRSSHRLTSRDQDSKAWARGKISIHDGLTRYQRVVILPQSAKVYYPTCKAWNEYLPIHRLPTELLLHIFLLAITPRDLERMPGKHPIARVCSPWREIVLGTPEFWTKISNNSSRNLVELKIQRSGNAKLDFILSPPPGFGKPYLHGYAFTELIRTSMWRCNSFLIRTDSTDVFHDWIGSGNPRCHIPSLAIESSDSFGRYLATDSMPTEIQNLCLKNVNVPWRSNFFPKLLSLQLTGEIETAPAQFLWNNKAPSALSVITDILKACPSLKVLKLGRFRYGFGTRVDETSDQDQFTSFPSLESLEMRGRSTALFWEVLDKISFPSLSKLYIYAENVEPYSRKVTEVLCGRVGGQSLLRSVIDGANCERLVISIAGGPSGWIKLRGVNEAGTCIHLDPLSRDSSATTTLAVLGAIKSPVIIEIHGQPDHLLIQSLQGTSIDASICYLPSQG